ncbi:hypothetical protein EJ07DRAFT_150538 [Lizonia empirigonia]|nr:hypothetical protein EJ07DRAFT_150538 [Lizonia empirigonia]
MAAPPPTWAAHVAHVLAQPGAPTFVIGVGSLFAASLYLNTRPLRPTIDRSAPELPVTFEVFQPEQQSFDDIVIEEDAAAPLSPAPSLPVPFIWGHPNAISYTPAEPWNQAMTPRIGNCRVHADPALFLQLVMCILTALGLLIWSISKCCCNNRAASVPLADGMIPTNLVCNPTPPNSRVWQTPDSSPTLTPTPGWFLVASETGESSAPASFNTSIPPPSRYFSPPSAPAKELAELLQEVKKWKDKHEESRNLAVKHLGDKERVEQESANRIRELEAQLENLHTKDAIESLGKVDGVNKETPITTKQTAEAALAAAEARTQRMEDDLEDMRSQLRDANARAVGLEVTIEDLTNLLSDKHEMTGATDTSAMTAPGQTPPSSKDKAEQDIGEELKQNPVHESKEKAKDLMKDEDGEILKEFETDSLRPRQAPAPSPEPQPPAGKPAADRNTPSASRDDDSSVAAPKRSSTQDLMKAEDAETLNKASETDDLRPRQALAPSSEPQTPAGKSAADDDSSAEQSSTQDTLPPIPSSTIAKPYDGPRGMLASRHATKVPGHLKSVSPKRQHATPSTANTQTPVQNTATRASLHSSRYKQETSNPTTPSRPPALQPTATPFQPDRKNLTTPSPRLHTSPIPTGPSPTHTCPTCHCTFTDTPSFAYARDHHPKCLTWAHNYAAQAFVNVNQADVTKGVRYPPHFRTATQRPRPEEAVWLGRALGLCEARGVDDRGRPLGPGGRVFSVGE